VEIRPARPDDVDAVVAGYDWLFAPPGSVPGAWDPQAAAARLSAAIAGDDAEVLVAVDDGAVVGLCTVYYDIDSVRFGRRAWVEDLAVDPERRSQGVGKALLDAAKHWARERGAVHLELDSAMTRADAHRFYRREGAEYESITFGWTL
jgi:GNAT superfamily N-acetyltransferase